MNGIVVNKVKSDPSVNAATRNKTKAMQLSIVLDKRKANGAIIITSASRNAGNAAIAQVRAGAENLALDGRSEIHSGTVNTSTASIGDAYNYSGTGDQNE